MSDLHRRAPSRRTVVRTAAWAVPAVSIVTAAPAFAASGDPWTITSNSWEGGPGGLRFEASTYYMNFTIAVPAGVTLSGLTATLQFGTNEFDNQIRAGQAGNTKGWTTSREDSVGAHSGRFIFSHGDVTGATTVQLSFVLNSLIFITGTGTIGTLTFTAVGQPTKVYQVLKNNVDGSIVSPAV
ncbi:MAG: hypothetical protein ACI379_04600 [Nocardioides sp.]|uniref:hypothetical protein n=1 Tax=Nocardioides sp. TaxID=35761 RepID=UPI003EFBDB81